MRGRYEVGEILTARMDHADHAVGGLLINLMAGHQSHLLARIMSCSQTLPPRSVIGLCTERFYTLSNYV